MIKKSVSFTSTVFMVDGWWVIVVGDIDVDEMEAKVKSHFGKYKNPANPKERHSKFQIIKKHLYLLTQIKVGNFW